MLLSSFLDFNKAFRRINQDRRDDAWPDVVGYRDIKSHLDEFIQYLCINTQQPKQYKAHSPLLIDIPKRGFTLRPGIVPLIEDRIIYQACADYLAPHFVAENNVYSNRLADDNEDQMFIQGVELWIDFQNKIEEYCGIYPFVVETDITAYFDHINHDLLLSRISDLFAKSVGHDELDNIRAILTRLLNGWSFYGLKKFGIPQINDASSFFANLYLDEFDKWLLAQGLVALRYVDDIRIFAEDEPKARNALADVIVKLRDIGLSVASGKTKIKKSEDVLLEVHVG